MAAVEPASAAELADRFHRGERRAQDQVADCLARIAAHDPTLHAFVEVHADRALARAADQDTARARGAAVGPLAGVPFAIKDNLLLAGARAACGSRMLADFVAPYTATVVQRLEDLGAIALGRTNMDEFGMGSTTEKSAFGPTRNPWDPTRVPGGSSGGAAAAIAADFCPLALGSDTGGSVRQPAALCGVAGLRPTYGRLSRHGLVAYASSLDCIGALARRVDDLALALLAAGPDPLDATSAERAAPVFQPPGDGTDLRGVRLGVPTELADLGVDADVDVVTRAALDRLQDLGAEIVPVQLPHLRHAVAAYYLIASAEASSNLARYDGVHFGHRSGGQRTLEAMQTRSRSDGFGAEVQLRVLLGTFALQHGYQDRVYGQATRVRALLQRDFAAAFAGCSAIACATSPMAAFALGQQNRDPIGLYRADALTVPPSLAGLPALSLPCGMTRGGLPVGLQLIAPAFEELRLLQIGSVYQQHTDWHRRRALP